MKRIYVLGGRREGVLEAHLEHIDVYEVISVGVFSDYENGEPVGLTLVLDDGTYALVDVDSVINATTRYFNKKVSWEESVNERQGEV